MVNINKNYIFCNCVFQANNRLGIEQRNSSNQIKEDGSPEVYFIDEKFSVEPDAVIELVSEYLDSLETSGKFISYKNALFVQLTITHYFNRGLCRLCIVNNESYIHQAIQLIYRR